MLVTNSNLEDIQWRQCRTNYDNLFNFDIKSVYMTEGERESIVNETRYIIFMIVAVSLPCNKCDDFPMTNKLLLVPCLMLSAFAKITLNIHIILHSS